MKALRILLIVLLTIVAVFLIYLSTISGRYEVVRSTEIDAPKNMVMNHIENLETWEKWSYWNLIDSTNVVTYGDKRSGVGASYGWTGMETGKGEMEILSIEDGKSIATMIRFMEPFESEMNSDFRFEDSENGGVKVSWVNYGEMPFFLRFMAKGMDAAFGEHLSIGLDSLKRQIERQNVPAQGRVESIGEAQVESMDYYYVRHDISISEMGDEIMASSFASLTEYLGEDMQHMMAPPFSITELWDEEAQRTIFRVCVAVNSSKPENEEIKKDKTYAGRVLQAQYMGPYDHIAQAYYDLESRMEELGLEMAGDPWETYMTDPAMEPNPANWLTVVSWPVK